MLSRTEEIAVRRLIRTVPAAKVKLFDPPLAGAGGKDKFGKTDDALTAFDGTTLTAGTVSIYSIDSDGTLTDTNSDVEAYWAYQDNGLSASSWVTLRHIAGKYFAEPTSCDDLT